MDENIIELPQIAKPSIEDVFREFLTEQRERLSDKTFRRYDEIIALFRGCLNNYAYQALSKPETILFDKHFNADGEDHREFCQLFGPEKISNEVAHFLNYYMVRKVIAGADFKRAAGTVTKKLCKWLAEKGYVSEEGVGKGIEDAADAIHDLPDAERAGDFLFRLADRCEMDPDHLSAEDYLDFDHYTIMKIEPGKLWFEVFDEHGKRTIGPVSVQKTAAKLLKTGWDISCAFGRVNSTWRIIEMGSVYPR